MTFNSSHILHLGRKIGFVMNKSAFLVSF